MELLILEAKKEKRFFPKLKTLKYPMRRRLKEKEGKKSKFEMGGAGKVILRPRSRKSNPFRISTPKRDKERVA